MARDSSAPGTVPLHRFYASGDSSYHRHSLSPQGHPNVNYEGVECRVWAAQQPLVSMAITAPKAGEELKGGSNYDISWNSSVKGGYISINYSKDAGTNWIPITSGVENKGFLSWRVPNIDTSHARVQIIWTDNLFGQTNVLAIAESANDFKIKRSRLTPRAVGGTHAVVKYAAPTGFMAKAVSSYEIKLSWQAAKGNVQGYVVERRP